MPDEQSVKAKQKLRWNQYSLRSLFILMILVAIASSWLAVEMQKAGNQKKTVEAILKLGGQVTYDYEFDASGSQILGAKPFGPEWLRKLLGDDLFTNVILIGLSGSKVMDADLEQYKELKHLKMLMLAKTQVTDAGVKHIKELQQLEYLDLRKTKVTDTGLEYLEGLKQLKFFLLGKTQITDAGVEKLQKSLPNCRIEH
jgi:hypothetical protein